MIELIKEVDLKLFLPLLGVVIGGIFTLLGVVIANKSSETRLKIQIESEHHKKQIQLKREKLDNLYILLTNWRNMFFSYTMNISLIMEGKINYNEHLDRVIKGDFNDNIDFQRLEMIVNIYIPELLPNFNNVLELREKIMNVRDQHKKDYSSGKVNGEKYISPLMDAYSNFDSEIEKLRANIAKLALNS